jgi:hypothetical protein
MSDKKSTGADQPKRQCDQCGSKDVICTHSYKTKRCGWTKKLRCESCGNTWKHFQTPPLLPAGMGIRKPEHAVLRTFALGCLGCPLEEVAGLTGHKSETIHDWLGNCITRPEIWHQITQNLVSVFKVEIAEVKAFSAKVLKGGQGKLNFHAISRHGAAATLKPKTERRRLSRTEQTMAKKHLLVLPGEDAEVTFQKALRAYEAPRLIPLTKKQQAARELLRRRVEAIVGEAIVVAPTGEFYRRDDDPRVEKWIHEIKHCGSAIKAKLLPQLGAIDQQILEYIQSPDEAARVMARLDGARGTKFGSPVEEKMTASCLAEGIGLGLGELIRHTKSLAQSLRSLSRPGATVQT